MGLNWRWEQLAPGGTGNVTIGLPSNFDPKAVIAVNGSYNSVGNSWNPCIGFGTYRGGTVQQRCFNTRGLDAAASADLAWNMSNTALLTQMTQSAGASSIDVEVDLVSMSTGATSNVVINVVNVATGGEDFWLLILGGSDITDALVGDFTITNSGTTKDVTVVSGFGKPDFIFCGGVQDSFGVSATSPQWTFGFGEQGTTGMSTAFTMTDGNTASIFCMGQRTNRIWQKIAPAGASYESIAQLDTTVSNWPTDGFRLLFDAVPSFTTILAFLALKGTFSKKTYSNTAPTSGGLPVVQDNACGFPPLGAFIMGWNQVAKTTIDISSADLGALSYGAWWDSGGGSIVEGSQQFSEDDAALTMDSNSWTSGTKVIRNYNQSGALQSEADGSASGNNSRLSWNDIDTVARQYIGFSFGNAAGGATTQVPLAAGLTLTPAISDVMTARRSVVASLVLTPVFNRRYFRTLAAGLVATAAMQKSKMASVAVPATENLTALMTPIKTKPVALNAVLNLGGAVSMIRTLRLAISAGLILTPVAVKKMLRPMAVTETLTPTMTRTSTAYRLQAVTLTLTGVMTPVKKYSRAIAANLTLVGVMTPKQLKIQALPVTLTLSPTMARVLTAPRLLAATVTMIISVVKKNPRTLAVTETLTVVVVRVASYPRTLAATLILTVTNSLRLIRVRSIAANLTLTPIMTPVKLKLQTAAATLTLTAAMTPLKRTARTLAVNLTPTLTMTRIMAAPRALAASLTLTPALIRKFNLLITLNATLTANVAIVKKFIRTLATGITLTPTMGNKQLQLRTLAANLSLTAALTRVKTAPRLLTASETLTAALSKRPRLIRNVNLNLTAGSTLKSTFKLNLPADLSFVPNMVRRYFRNFNTTLPLTVVMTRTEGFTQISFNVTLNLVAKMNAFKATLGRVWLYAATTPSRIWAALTKPKVIDTVTDTTIIDASETKPRLHDVE